MPNNKTNRWSAGPLRLPLRGGKRVASYFLTIRGRILVACLVMSAITATVGSFAVQGIRDAGVLVDKTYDQSLMSINYARAAATDFNAMRAVFARLWIASDTATQLQLQEELKTHYKTFEEDLAVTMQRAQSHNARQAAANVQRAVKAWKNVSDRMLAGTALDANWTTLDAHAAKVDEQIDLLVNYTAGNGFLYRQIARATVSRDAQLNIAGIALALLLSALIAWALVRQIVGPVAIASNVAEHIATGKLDVIIPKGSPDELGDLLKSMGVMRDNIRAMMEREVAQRRSAQTRLADAMESSQEGVVVVDPDGRIALANEQAAALFGLSADLLKPGRTLEELTPALEGAVRDGRVLAKHRSELPSSREVMLTDGRWLRLGQSATRDGGFILVCMDISLSKKQEDRLRQTNLRLDAALDNMSQGLCLYDSQSKLKVANRRFFEIFGLPQEKVQPGISFREIMELKIAAGNHAGKSADELLADRGEFINLRRAGTHHYELSDGRVIASVYTPTSDGGWVATYEDVTQRRQAEAKIMHMARHDALTGLPNRVLFNETMERALQRGDSLAVLFLDLDRFKSINDTLGHSTGDALLCEVTKRLLATASAADTVARLGGDEFAIVQIGARPTDASELAGRIIEEVSTTFNIVDHQLMIGISIGIAMSPTDGTTADQLLRNADMALYRAKSEGRGAYHFFQPEMDERMQARRALELDLRKAIANGEFEIHYQPILFLQTGKVSGFEALLRWNHPERGQISPVEFIPLAEETGLIVPLGEWVLRTACMQASRWPQPVGVAVNLSAMQFKGRNLVQLTLNALAASGLAAGRLDLEITESVLLRDEAHTLAILHQLRALGLQISMDDFGTGYSSLAYLRNFPFDKIKIDRSFVRDMMVRNDCQAIVRAVVGLARSLGITTIIEGIETKEQLEIAKAEGCDEGQGFLFSKAIPDRDIPEFLAKRDRISVAA
jgi:diguanylate cyclase (GGDEF)-like protein/PAS domain S-box-containing protein